MLCLPIHGEPRNVRHGPLAHISGRCRHVRFTPNSGHSSVQVACPLRAIKRHWRALIETKREPRRERRAPGPRGEVLDRGATYFGTPTNRAPVTLPSSPMSGA